MLPPMRAFPGFLLLTLLPAALGAQDAAELALTCAEEAILIASVPLSGDSLGESVALYGDTAVVGAPQDGSGAAGAGSAYVFVRSGATWVEQQQLIPGDAALNDHFGFAVGLWGDTAVVGAYRADPGGALGAGSAYVFVRSGTVWSEQQKLIATNPMDGDHFGSSVGIWEDTVAVGAARDDSPLNDAGSVFVFVRNGTTWSLEQRLAASDASVGDRFGTSVDVEGDTAVVGVPRDSHGLGAVEAGSAYVFVRSGTSWGQEQKLVASDADQDDNFGQSVAVSGGTVLVGAPRDDHDADLDAGSAYVWSQSGTTWNEQEKLVGGSTGEGDYCGSSVDLAGDTAVVGAPWAKDGWLGEPNGSAYVFERSGATWAQQQELFTLTGDYGDELGLAIALSGDTVAVGAPGDDYSGKGGAGSACVFRVCPLAVTYCTAGISSSGCQATLSASGVPSTNASFGFTVMAANVEGAKDGAFFFGTGGQQANPWGNGTSFLCIVPPVTRTGVLDGSGTPGLCDGSFNLDLNTLWWPAIIYKGPPLGTPVQAQLWYRDPGITSNKKTSLSDALEFCVAP